MSTPKNNTPWRFKMYLKKHLLFKIIPSLLTLLAIALFSINVWANNSNSEEDLCLEIANELATHCLLEGVSETRLEKVRCLNMTNSTQQQSCLDEIEAYNGTLGLCVKKYQIREEVCGKIGDEPYDPDFNSANFVDPRNIGNGIEPNNYFPLIPGSTRHYNNRMIGHPLFRTMAVNITNDIKVIQGVSCLVVTTLIRAGEGENEQLIRETDDWYAQDLDGNVWRCGREVKRYRKYLSTELSLPEGTSPELTSIEGSYKAGREHSKPGIWIKKVIEDGDIYRQEAAYTQSEDTAEIIDINADGLYTINGVVTGCSSCVEIKYYDPLQSRLVNSPEQSVYYYGKAIYKPGIGLVRYREAGDFYYFTFHITDEYTP